MKAKGYKIYAIKILMENRPDLITYIIESVVKSVREKIHRIHNKQSK